MPLREFTDYRTFLVAYAQGMKRSHAHWSYGAWALRMGLKDTSSLTKILNGDREPGHQITEKMVEYFKFKEKDAAYFRDLVQLSKLRKNPRLSVLLMEKMRKEHPRSAHQLMDEKTFSVLSTWFHLPLREMVRLAEFQEDPEWISRQMSFKLGAREARQALETLLDVGLLKRNESGRLEPGGGELSTANDVANEAVKRYHEQTLENARTAIRQNDVDRREFQAESLSFSMDRMPEAKAFIREFRQRFSQTFDADRGDAVFQIQVQFFPVTKPK